MNKRAVDIQGFQQALGHPAVLGGLLGAAPAFTKGLTAATGGLGLFGLMNLIQHGGRHMGALTRGPLASRNPATAFRPPRPLKPPAPMSPFSQGYGAI